ncbi:MAG: succinate dehydrogenase iron-sulfur subunit, partial [Planctomycetes bacterium RBG_16_43_13]
MTKDAMHKNVDIKIKRQDSPTAEPRWELFSIPYKPNMNIIICLMEIQRNPITKFGHKTTPPVWDCNCLEEVCGACTMVINGRVRQACSTLVDTLEHLITVEPMSKFPLVRDLIVDRSKMFEALKRVRAWAPIDGTHEQGPGSRIPAKTAEEAYWLSRCMTCGCCLEACPQINKRSDFIGAAAISQVRLFNMTSR